MPLGPGQTLGFQRGRGYYALAHPAAPAAPAQPALPTLLQQAVQIAQQAQAPGRQDILNQQQRAQDQATQRQQFIAGLYKAAAEMAKGVGPSIGANFQNAADSTAAYGQGYSSQFKNTENTSADQLNGLLAKWGGAPVVAGDKGGADVLNGLGGVIPASNLATQGAAFKSAADFLPTTTMLRGTDAVKADQNQVTMADQAFTDALKKLDAEYPGTLQQVYTQLQQSEASTDAARYNHALAIWQTTGKVTPQVAALLGIPAGTKSLAQQRLEQQGKAETARTKIAQQKASQPNASLSRLYGVVVDSNGNAIAGADGKPQPVKTSGSKSSAKASVGLSKVFGFLVDPSGNPILRGGKPVYLPNKGKAGKPKYTATTLNRYTGRAETIAAGAFNGLPDSKPGAGDALPPVDYREAIDEMRKAGIPPEVYLKILNSGRYYLPGRRGRPLPSDKVLADDLARKMGWAQ